MIISCSTHCKSDICAQETVEVISLFKTIWLRKPRLCNLLSSSSSLFLVVVILFGFQRIFCHFVSCARVPGKFLGLNTELFARKVIKGINFVKLALDCLYKSLCL